MENMIAQWKQMSKDLAELKREEMKLRKTICNKILNGMGRPATKTVKIAGERVQAKALVTLNLDESSLNAFFKELNDQEKSAVKYKPGLIMARYKDLPGSSLLHEAVIEKPAAPTLKIVD